MTLPRALTSLAAVSIMLLSGCGVAGTNFHPGTAAEVGNESVSVAKVDKLAAAYCSAIKPQLSGQVVPQRYLRGGIVGQLTLAAAARQLAGDYGVQPGTQYEQQVAQVRSAVTSLPEDQQDAVVEVESASAYLTGVLLAIGEQALRAAGTETPDPTAATAEGQKALIAWLDQNEVTIDPQFGISIVDGQQVATETGVSFAVGDAAKQAQADTPDQEYAGSLPASHRCG